MYRDKKQLKYPKNVDTISHRLLITNKNNLFNLKPQISTDTAGKLLLGVLTPQESRERPFLTYLLEIGAILLIFAVIQTINPIKF